MHVTGGGEEGDVNGYKNRESSPPSVNPHKSRRLHQKYFQNGGNSCIGNRKGPTVIDAQNFLRGSFGSSLQTTIPAMANIRLISTPTPTSNAKAVPEGTVHRACPEQCWINAFTISTNQWTM